MNIGIDARTALMERKGGYGIYTRNLIKSMASSYPNYSFNLKYVNKIEHSISGYNNIDFNKLDFPLKMLWTQLRLPLHFINYQPDVFLFPSQSITRFSSCKKVVTIHDLRFKALENHNRLEYHRLNLQMKNCINYSDQIICVSNQTKIDLMEYYSVDESIINVIYHGADHFKEINKQTAKIDQNYLSNKYKLPENFLLTVGFTMKHKNLTTAIFCLKALIKKNHNINLVMVGPEGDDEQNILKAISSLKLENRVLRIPYVNSIDLPYLYYYSKLFIYPSLYEGFGFPILEAMRSGAIVAGSKISSIPEIGSNAMIYFNPYDLEEMIFKVDSLLSNKEKQKQLKLAGYNQAKTFKWKETAKKTIQTLEN